MKNWYSTTKRAAVCGVGLTATTLPVWAAGDGGSFATAVTALGAMEGGVKSIVAIVAFLVALISLVALRSFTVILALVGLAIFGSVGLAIVKTLIGASTALI